MSAPLELQRFAFLIGRYRCNAKLKLPAAESQSFEAIWEGRWILDGYAIADEYRMFDADGETIVLGVNIRAYDPAKKQWNIKWLHALAGTWTDLGPGELGGVHFDGSSVSYVFNEPMAGHALTRATYTNISSATSPGRASARKMGTHGRSSWSSSASASESLLH